MKTLLLGAIGCGLWLGACGNGDQPPRLNRSTSGHPDSGADGSAPASTATDSGAPDAAASVPTEVTFDPAEVYLFGGLTLSDYCRKVVTHYTTPDSYAFGFPCRVQPEGVKIRGNSLLYTIELLHAVRRFVPEGVAALPATELDYPVIADDNDPLVPTPACPAGTDTGPMDYHNYNDNTELVNAIEAGSRGAYWHILHKLRS
jgi:hypothetical protein